MENGNFPTSRDIYLEVNGRKLAVVEDIKPTLPGRATMWEAFGSAEPVGTVPGKTTFCGAFPVYASRGRVR